MLMFAGARFYRANRAVLWLRGRYRAAKLHPYKTHHALPASSRSPVSPGDHPTGTSTAHRAENLRSKAGLAGTPGAGYFFTQPPAGFWM